MRFEDCEHGIEVRADVLAQLRFRRFPCGRVAHRLPAPAFEGHLAYGFVGIVRRRTRSVSEWGIRPNRSRGRRADQAHHRHRLAGLGLRRARASRRPCGKVLFGRDFVGRVLGAVVRVRVCESGHGIENFRGSPGRYERIGKCDPISHRSSPALARARRPPTQLHATISKCRASMVLGVRRSCF